MSDKKQPKIGDIKLNDAQKQMVAEFVESDMFKLIKNVIRPKRQIRIGQTGIRGAQDESDLFYYKGMLFESDWLPTHLEQVARDYNKDQDKGSD